MKQVKRAKTCGNCRWWQTLRDFEPGVSRHSTDTTGGVCRRLSPEAISDVYRAWPGTQITDWCGEWKMTEEAEAEARKVVTR
jgi:hypothetical protein